jgi:hypothetical protein
VEGEWLVAVGAHVRDALGDVGEELCHRFAPVVRGRSLGST